MSGVFLPGDEKEDEVSFSAMRVMAESVEQDFLRIRHHSHVNLFLISKKNKHSPQTIVQQICGWLKKIRFPDFPNMRAWTF